MFEKQNKEGYTDMTAGIAIENISRSEKKAKYYRPLVYVCSPYRGDVKRNVELAKAYCRYVISQGGAPVAAHLLYPRFLDDSDPEERITGLEFALLLLEKCDELWVFGDKISRGMAHEIHEAKMRGMPVLYIK